MVLEHITHKPQSTIKTTPLLFVHGAWHGAWCWAENFLPYFAQQGYASHALSLRGHGASPATKAMFLNGIWDYVADVKTIADKIATESGQRPALIGHSMGGYIVQKYLERHSAPAAVLVASIPVMGVFPFQIRLLRYHPLDMLKCTLTLRAYPLISTAQKAHKHFFSASMPTEQVQLYHSKMGDESLRILLDAGLLHRPRSRKIQPTPLLVTTAANDLVFPLHEEEATARAYQTPLKVYADMAHDMMLEAGWQKVADDIIHWLDEQGL